MLMWATRMQHWNVLLLEYVIRSAIENLHPLKGELHTMEDTPGNPKSTSSSDEFEDSAEQLNRMRDTLNELKTALFAFEEQFLATFAHSQHSQFAMTIDSIDFGEHHAVVSETSTTTTTVCV